MQPGNELIKMIETRIQSYTSMSSNSKDQRHQEDFNRLQPSSLSQGAPKGITSNISVSSA